MFTKLVKYDIIPTLENSIFNLAKGRASYNILMYCNWHLASFNTNNFVKENIYKYEKN